MNFDDLYRKATREPYIVNNESESSEEDKQSFNRKIYTKYATDLLSNLPSCECGEIVGEANKELICSNCHTEVVAPLEQDLESFVWLRAPKGVAALMNPVVWTMLSLKFTRSGYDIIRYLCDTKYAPAVKVPAIMAAVQDLNIERGYNNFVNNFDDIIAALFDLKGIKARKGEEDELQQLLREQRDCIFSQYLPLPNRSLLVIEETNVGTYVDPIATTAVDAIRTMMGIDTELCTFTTRVKENRTVKTIAQLASFYEELSRSTLATKEGIFRKHVFGTRSHFSFRAVISSLTREHDYDELHIPWGIGISVLRIHLLNKLLRRGYTPNRAIEFLNEHAGKYHPLLDELFQLLISEGPYKGLPVIFQRNPSLERGSAQAMFITHVKTDVAIPTVSLSILSVVGFNADFDGDQLNATLSIDGWTAEELSKLAPHKSVFDLNEPRKVSRNLSMPKPVVATIAAAVHSIDAKRIDPHKAEYMAQIPECGPFVASVVNYTPVSPPVTTMVAMEPSQELPRRRATDYVRRSTDEVPTDPKI